MTQEQKDYIETNIELIENNDWETFFQNAHDGIGGVLYEAGIYFMDDLIEIPDWAFYKYEDLTSMIISKGVTRIGRGSFCDCSNLKSIIIPESVTSIGYEAFKNCANLTNIIIPDGVDILAWGMFENCNNLKSVVLGKGINHIANEPFRGCSNLTTINFNGTKNMFKKIKKHGNWTRSTLTIRCIDGDLTYTRY